MNTPVTAILLLGSNLGNREQNLDDAIRLLGEKAGTPGKISSVYETEPWGETEQPLFLNQALGLKTELEPGELLKCILGIEKTMGRIREKKWKERIIDIDILFYGEAIIHTEHLHVPHPQLHLRRFALTPLAEIFPDLVHPVFHKSIVELMASCEDELKVTKKKFLHEL